MSKPQRQNRRSRRRKKGDGRRPDKTTVPVELKRGRHTEPRS